MNVFLTGDKNSGKSTIIDDFLSKYQGAVTGIRTIREKTDLDSFFGIYIFDVNDKNKKFDVKNRVGECKPDKSLTCFCDKLATLTLSYLKDYKKSDIIVFDELGNLENDCIIFQKKVMECLSSDVPVLGVLKKVDLSFINKIRKRDDVRIIEVTQENRDTVLSELTHLYSL